MLSRLLPGAVPFGFMLLQDHAGGHLLDVPILALFFFADTAYMFLLGYRTLPARMEHLFGQPRCHTPASEQNLFQALRHGQPRIGTSTPAAALAAVALVFPHACLP